MAKIYTSYYGKCKDLSPEKYILIQISNSSPFNCHGKLDSVIPDWNSIVAPYKRGEIDKEEYEDRYLKQLRGNSIQILGQIDLMMSAELGKDIVLLCYEKTGDFCHRNILREWVNDLKFKEVILEIE